MSDRITIDFARVAQSVQAVQAASDAIRATLNDLDGQLALLEGAWEGEAFEAYRAMRVRWEAQMRAAQARLAAYATVMEQAGTGFAENERQLATSF